MIESKDKFIVTDGSNFERQELVQPLIDAGWTVQTVVRVPGRLNEPQFEYRLALEREIKFEPGFYEIKTPIHVPSGRTLQVTRDMSLRVSGVVKDYRAGDTINYDPKTPICLEMFDAIKDCSVRNVRQWGAVKDSGLPITVGALTPEGERELADQLEAREKKTIKSMALSSHQLMIFRDEMQEEVKPTPAKPAFSLVKALGTVAAITKNGR